jgi:microcystin-dependent protein
MSTLNEVVNLPNFGVANGIVNRTSWQDNLRTPLGVPPGSIILYAGYTGPSGYFMCQGQAVSRYVYTDLFSAIGTTYGPGDGVSTFNLPNLKGYTPVCYDTSYTGFNTLGKTGGEINHTLTLNEMPTHLHSGPTELAGSHFHTGTTDSAGTHTHNYQDAYFAENIGGGANNVFGTNGGTDTDNSFYWRTSGGGYSTSPSDIPTSSTGAHQHDFTTSTQTSHRHDFTTTTSGGSGPHNNLQPYIVMNYIIKF